MYSFVFGVHSYHSYTTVTAARNTPFMWTVDSMAVPQDQTNGLSKLPISIPDYRSRTETLLIPCCHFFTTFCSGILYISKWCWVYPWLFLPLVGHRNKRNTQEYIALTIDLPLSSFYALNITTFERAFLMMFMAPFR